MMEEDFLNQFFNKLESEIDNEEFLLDLKTLIENKKLNNDYFIKKSISKKEYSDEMFKEQHKYYKNNLNECTKILNNKIRNKNIKIYSADKKKKI